MIDTYESIKSLKSAGFNELQAEAIVEQFRKAWDARIGELATKEDIREVKLEIGDVRRDIKEMGTGLRRDMKEMETSLRHDMKEMETSLRHDMKEMETSLRHDMKEMETSLRHDMKDMELRLTIKLGAMLAASIAIVATLVKLL